jgi:prevent-host-death family protein
MYLCDATPMSTETLSLSDLRPRLSEAIGRAHELFDRFVITRRGRAEAVLLGAEDYEGLLETLDILSDQDLVKRLAIAEGEVERGETIGFDELRQQIRSGTFGKRGQVYR